MYNIQTMFFISGVTFLIYLSVCIAGDPCPPKTELEPCTCSYSSYRNWTFELGQSETFTTPRPVTELKEGPKRDDNRGIDGHVPTTPSLAIAEIGNFYTVVDCKDSKTLTALEETVSSALNRKLVDKLIVSNVPPVKEHALARLPSGWLQKVRVRQFEVLNSKLSGDFIWYNNPFEGQGQSLLWLTASKCLLSGSLTFDTFGTVNTKGLDLLPHLQGVNFSQNYLTSILSNSFRFPPKNLTTVVLARNSIQLIEGATFIHIPFLKYVDLSHNLLQSVISSIFASPARHLQHIDLSWNSLTALPADFFSNMPALQTVDVSNNFLYSMPEKPWASIWRQLKNINIQGNFVKCNCDLMWLLPILSPPEVNATTTAVPAALPGQTVNGFCSKTVNPQLFATKYELVTLTRSSLTCRT